MIQDELDALSLWDLSCMDSAELMARNALQKRNLPIGCVISLDAQIIATGENAIHHPTADPWRHAECEALRHSPPELWTRARDMTLYTTLEPCIMCLSTLILHGIGRIVYGACDKRGGGSCILPHLPPFYGKDNTPILIGPTDPQRFDKYYELADRMFQ